MSFFHLKYANAQTQILNIDVRSNILCDYFHKNILARAADYVHTKTATVAHDIEETKVNLTHLNGIVADIGVAALSNDGGIAEEPPPTSDATATPTVADLNDKIAQLEELLKTLTKREEATMNWLEKIKDVALEDIDVCDDSGTPMGLSDLGSSAASDVLESRATYVLCRKTDDKVVVMLNFAVLPDSSINLETLLGPSRIKVTNTTRGQNKRQNKQRSKQTGQNKQNKLTKQTAL
jgi:hypothetical protein